MKTFAMMNMKGGVGKTVTTIQLATILTNQYGKTVLVVDCDGQCNLSRFYAADYIDDMTVANVMERSCESYRKDNVQLVRPNLYLLPASRDLYRLDLAAMQNGNAHINALRNFVEVVAEDQEVDVVLFDCPPGFTAASTAALIAADELIIPILMDGFSIEGMAEMALQVESMRQVNPRLKVAGVLINQWHRCQAVEQGEKLLREMKLLPVFRQVIRRTDKVPESTFVKQPVMDYSYRSAASQDYRLLAQEIFGEVPDNGSL